MIVKANDVVLRVRPVALGLEHKYYYEGPCRFGVGEALQPGYDRISNALVAKEAIDELKASVPEGVVVLSTVSIARTDDWENPEEQWQRIAADIQDCDVLAVVPRLGTDDLMIELVERFNKPVMFCPDGICGIAETAALQYKPMKNYQVYAHIDWEHMRLRLAAMRAAKVIRTTSILLATRFGSTTSFSSVDSFNNYDTITSRLGVHFRFLNVHELLDQMSPAAEGGNHTTPGRVTPDLTKEDLALAEQLADELTAGADEVQVDREFLKNSLIAYVTVKKNLDLKDCNGFTVPCPDTCSTRRLNEMKFTFCLTHSLLMEQGIPSACEFDVSAVLSQQALIAVSFKNPYMGNGYPIPYHDGKLTLRQDATEKELAQLMEHPENLYGVQHSVAHRRIADTEKNGCYALRHFAFEQKFGAVLRYDFSHDAGKTVTVCRFSPDGSRLFIGRGTVVGGTGYDTDNCNNHIIFQVKDQRDFFEKQCKAGMHLQLVYGDYVDKLIEMAKILGIEPMVSA